MQSVTSSGKTVNRAEEMEERERETSGEQRGHCAVRDKENMLRANKCGQLTQSRVLRQGLL